MRRRCWPDRAPNALRSGLCQSLTGRHTRVELSILVLILAAAACAYTVLATFLMGRHTAAPGRQRDASMAEGVTVLKPLYGDEPRLAANLATVLEQNYPGAVEFIFGVASRTDPAAAVVEGLIAAYPAHRIQLSVDACRHGRNGKVSNLINMVRHATQPIIVLADSDMAVGPDYLNRVVAALAEPGVGAVTCLYRGLALPNLWSRLAAQWIDHHFLPNVVVGMALGMAKPCFGSTIALRRETLDRIGGFTRLKDVLADDYQLGEAVRGLGLRVAVPPDLVLGHLCAATTPGALVRQELRWARTIRAIDPVGSLGSIVTHPIPLATFGIAVSGFTDAALGLLAIAVAARLWLQLAVARRLRVRPSGLILGPLRDYAAFLIFLTSFWPGSIDWRGDRLALRSDGTLA